MAAADSVCWVGGGYGRFCRIRCITVSCCITVVTDNGCCAAVVGGLQQWSGVVRAGSYREQWSGAVQRAWLLSLLRVGLLAPLPLRPARLAFRVRFQTWPVGFEGFGV